jgi:iron complex outermembrane receptor protein
MGFVEQQYDARSDSSVNGAVSATWEISPVWAAQLSLATSTRFPTVGELYQGGLDSNGDFDPNSFDPNLQAEKSRDANLILRRDFGAVQVTGSAFFQRVEDAIFQQQGFNQFGVIVTNFQNIDVVRQFGVEGIIETKDFLIPGLNSEINVAFIDAETIRNDSNPASEGVQFARIPKWRINGNVRYDFTESLRGSVGWRYNTRPNSDLEGLRRGDTFGYSSEQFIVDLRMSYAVSDNVEISGGIDNVNNDKAWAFHPFPQRTFLIEAKWRQ